MPNLKSQLEKLHGQQSFTFVADLTRGKITKELSFLKETPQWNNFSVSRIRQATNIDLPTNGHLISHNSEEIQNVLSKQNLKNVLVLDDTSFSGSTSLLFERLINQAFPNREMNFTHGFLILNTGKLGKNPGAKERLTKNNSQAVGGMKMHTPKDDGWHFFDMVNQENIENHFEIVREILSLLGKPKFSKLAGEILSNEKSLRLMFPKAISTDEIRDFQISGHFIGDQKLNGEFHVKNPQLLPNIIGQKHLMHPADWRGKQEESFALLIKLSNLLKKGKL